MQFANFPPSCVSPFFSREAMSKPKAQPLPARRKGDLLGNFAESAAIHRPAGLCPPFGSETGGQERPRARCATLRRCAGHPQRVGQRDGRHRVFCSGKGGCSGWCKAKQAAEGVITNRERKVAESFRRNLPVLRERDNSATPLIPIKFTGM